MAQHGLAGSPKHARKPQFQSHSATDSCVASGKSLHHSEVIVEEAVWITLSKTLSSSPGSSYPPLDL